MKIIKSYVDFSKEYSLNENLIKKSWMKIQEFFRNKYRKSAWIYYALFLKKSNKLPKNKIEIILPSNNSLDKMTEIPEKNIAILNLAYSTSMKNKSHYNIQILVLKI